MLRAEEASVQFRLGACERSGAANIARSSLSSIHLSLAHRSVPTPTTSRSAPLTLNLISRPLFTTTLRSFDFLTRSRSAARPDLRGWRLGPQISPPNKFKPRFFLFLAGRYEGRSKSFAIQYDVQMAETKQLHYFSM